MKSDEYILIKFWINVSLYYFWHSQTHDNEQDTMIPRDCIDRVDHQEISRFWNDNYNDGFLLKRIQVNEGKLRLIRYRTIIWRTFVPNSWSCLIYETIKNDRSVSAKLEPSIRRRCFSLPDFSILFVSCGRLYFTWWNPRISRWIRRW